MWAVISGTTYNFSMCGRFTRKESFQHLAELLSPPIPPPCAPRYNIAPSQLVACMRTNPETKEREWKVMELWKCSRYLSLESFHSLYFFSASDSYGQGPLRLGTRTRLPGAPLKKLILKKARPNYCLGQHLSHEAVSFSIPVTVPLEVESIFITGEVLRTLTKPIQGIQEFDLEPG